MTRNSARSERDPERLSRLEVDRGDPREVLVLAVEDDDVDRVMIRRLLAKANDPAYRVSFADTLAHGLSEAERLDPDVVLLDLHLPDSTGLSTVETFRDRAPSLPLVVLTGTADQFLARRAVQLGAQDYVFKDEVEADPLGRCIAHAMTRQALEQRLRESTAALAEQNERRERELAQLRTQLESELRDRLEIQERLATEHRLASLGTLAAGVAHELNNPIGAILLAAEATSESDDEVLRRRALGEIGTNAKRCGEIIRQILEMADPEQSSGREVDLRECCERAGRLCARSLYAGGTRLVFELPKEGVFCHAEPLEIEQVLLNLVRNAMEAGASRVVVSLEQSGEDAVIRVQDDGHGIAIDVAEKIFDPFFSTRQAEGGTGLGLSLSQSIVTRWGGALSLDLPTMLESERGACFELRLPIPSDARGVPG